MDLLSALGVKISDRKVVFDLPLDEEILLARFGCIYLCGF
jgi:hypothetical protein